jgi:chromosome segregation ATPase
MRSRAAASKPNEIVTPFGAVTEATISSLDDMNSEGLSLLRQKQKELNEYTDSVAKAEEYLAQLQTIIQAKVAELESISGLDDDQRTQQATIDAQLTGLASKHQEQVRQMKAEHEAELNSIHRDFAQTLDESRQWATRHCEIAVQEKLDEAAQLKAAAKEAKRHLNELTFVKNRATASRLIDAAQKKDADQIARLEEQISELTAVTREEIRDARAKIEECIAAVQLRRTAHARELQRLENEASERNERYQEHLTVLGEQYELERATIEQQIGTAETRAASTEQVIERLEKHHEAQLREVLGDMETVRKSYGLPEKKNRQQADALRQLVKESQDIAEECRTVEEEMRLIDQEVEQLESENRELVRETNRLAGILERNAQ